MAQAHGSYSGKVGMENFYFSLAIVKRSHCWAAFTLRCHISLSAPVVCSSGKPKRQPQHSFCTLLAKRVTTSLLWEEKKGRNTMGKKSRRGRPQNLSCRHSQMALPHRRQQLAQEVESPRQSVSVFRVLELVGKLDVKDPEIKRRSDERETRHE